MKKNIYKNFNISDEVYDFVNNVEDSILDTFKEIDEVKSFNQLKVLQAFQESELSQSDFFYATGYGYGDTGRDKTETIFSKVFKSEDALVRTSITSGTHAISIALFSLLNKDDILLSITSDPYDTLLEVIGVRSQNIGTLIEKGVHYEKINLLNGKIDIHNVTNFLKSNKVKMVMIQRSTGYTNRSALSISEIQYAINCIKNINKNIIVFVDNCYGEFTEYKEPIEVGADIIAGSLIKNPGGGIAVSGGYLVGRKDLIERARNHLIAPGISKDTGLSFGTTRTTLQGFFLSPHITSEAIKGATLFCHVFSKLGYKTIPNINDKRSDIILGIELGTEEKIIDFVRCVQSCASVGADVVPYPWDMPGYEDQVIMASGGFIDGSSIEISADGPLREPYIVYYQGGVVYEQSKLAVMKILTKFNECKSQF